MEEIRSYRIMFKLLENQYFRGASDELGLLLGAMTLLQDGKPADSAIREEWEQAGNAIDSQGPDIPFAEGLKLFK